MPLELRARGDELVTLRRPEARDGAAFVRAALRSRDRLSPWVFPAETIDAFDAMVARINPTYAPSLLIENATGEIVGAFNVSEIVRGNFLSAYLGYYVFDPFEGKGLMARGLASLIGFAFDDLGLHRLEANVQPANTRSVELVRRAGFEREGFSKEYLFIAGAWRDHERWAMVRPR